MISGKRQRVGKKFNKDLCKIVGIRVASTIAGIRSYFSSRKMGTDPRTGLKKRCFAKVSNNILQYILSWGLALGCFAYLFWKIDLKSFWQTLIQASPHWLLGVALLNILVLLLKAERWRLFVRPLSSLSFGETLCLTILGFFGNSILPARAGDVGRGLYLAKRGVPWAAGVSTVASDKLIDAIGLMSFVIPLIPSLPRFLRDGALLLLFMVSGIFVFILFFSRKFTQKDLVYARGRVSKALMALSLGTHGFKDKIIFFKAYLLTLFSWFLQIEMLILTAKALGLSLGFATALLTILGLNVALVLPTPPAGIGIAHAAIVMVLTHFGYAKPEALSIAVLYHGIQVMVLAVLGPVFWVLKSRLLAGFASANAAE